MDEPVTPDLWRQGILRVLAARKEIKLAVLKTVMGPLEPYYRDSERSEADYQGVLDAARELVTAEDEWQKEREAKAEKWGVLYSGLGCQSPTEDTGTKSS